MKVLELNGQHFHVTHSLRPPAKPVDSNALIKSGGDARQVHMELSGMLEMIRR